MSKAWLANVEGNLRLLVDQFADDSTDFTFCEVFSEAPKSCAGWAHGNAAYYYSIKGKEIEFHTGATEKYDVLVIVDYVAALSEATLVYTPEFQQLREEGKIPPSPVERDGDLSSMPSWIKVIHNMNVTFTKPVS